MLLGISGSLRAGSFNTLLLKEAARHYGGEFVLGDVRFPLYDGDLESSEGIPAEVETLAEQIGAAEAVLLSTPEYNQSMSGAIKNAIDWVSRVEGNPWQDKPVALLGAAAGRSGGARASYALRLSMVQFKPRMLSRELLVAGAHKEFDEDGRLTGEQYEGELAAYMDALKAEVARG